MRLFVSYLIIAAGTLLPASTHKAASQRAESIYALTTLEGDSGGTAFLVKAPSGREYLVSNAHVCDGAFVVQMGDKSFPTQALEIASDTDLCILTAPKEVAEADEGLEVADHAPILFEPVYVIGQGMLMGNALTTGHFVSQLPGKLLSVTRPYYITATVLPGNSGSPAFNIDGKVFGVVFASSGSINNRALLVPLEDLKKVLSHY